MIIGIFYMPEKKRKRQSVIGKHIESITNGNSKGLAYWIATGVIALVLNFTFNIVELAFEQGQANDNDVLIAMQYHSEQTLKQTEILEKISLQLSDRNIEHIEMDAKVDRVLRQVGG